MGETRRATIQEAARIMGVSEGAIRKRVKRGTLTHDKGPDGRVYVYLDAGVAEGVDEVPHPDTTALISRLEDEVRFLREELARKDAILLRMAESIPQLEAPPEPRGSPASANASSGSDTSQYVAEATYPEAAAAQTTDRTERHQARFALLRTAVAAVLFLFGTVIAAAGGFIYSIISAINGDQVVTIVSAVIGVFGTIGAAYLTVTMARGTRNRR